jgi:UDP-N-acetylmuramoylalanine--D-glutamate ligase
VTVLGLGREGLDLARYLVAEGALVRVTDQKPPEELGPPLEALADLPISYSLGGHPEAEVLETDLLLVSPGVDPETPVLQEARRRAIPISSATELFFSRCPGTIVGITGSSGKSTTTALVGEMARSLPRPVVVGGNIGRPLLAELAEMTPNTLVVMELSSFQLESLGQSPPLAAITNVTPNHLDRHPSMDAYTAAKARIFEFQAPGDRVVLNLDDPISRAFEPTGEVYRFSLKAPTRGAYLRGEELVLAAGGRLQTLCAVGDLGLRGRHNVANALTAALLAKLTGCKPAAIREVLRTFQGLRHRLEFVGELDGVRFFNDSIATAPERSLAALASFDEPLVLIAGGRDKHLPMEEWGRALVARVRGVVLFGEAAPLVRGSLDAAGYPAERIRDAATMAEAVAAGHELAEPGTVVLLSPGGTSYDMYENFEQRGEDFAAEVRSLIGRPR